MLAYTMDFIMSAFKYSAVARSDEVEDFEAEEENLLGSGEFVQRRSWIKTVRSYLLERLESSSTHYSTNASHMGIKMTAVVISTERNIDWLSHDIRKRCSWLELNNDDNFDTLTHNVIMNLTNLYFDSRTLLSTSSKDKISSIICKWSIDA